MTEIDKLREFLREQYTTFNEIELLKYRVISQFEGSGVYHVTANNTNGGEIRTTVKVEGKPMDKTFTILDYVDDDNKIYIKSRHQHIFIKGNDVPKSLVDTI